MSLAGEFCIENKISKNQTNLTYQMEVQYKIIIKLPNGGQVENMMNIIPLHH